MNSQLAGWQDLLDTSFPTGVIMQWEDKAAPGWGMPGPTYQVPWVEVTAMAGLDPVVGFGIFGVEKAFTALRVLSYEPLQAAPCYVARVTFDNVAERMLWSAGVSERLARRMAATRQHEQRLALAKAS